MLVQRFQMKEAGNEPKDDEQGSISRAGPEQTSRRRAGRRSKISAQVFAGGRRRRGHGKSPEFAAAVGGGSAKLAAA